MSLLTDKAIRDSRQSVYINLLQRIQQDPTIKTTIRGVFRKRVEVNPVLCNSCVKYRLVDLNPINNLNSSKEIIGEIFIDNENMIEYVKLIVGGSVIDVIYANMFDVLRHGYNMKGVPFHLLKYGVPVLEYHDVDVLIKYIGDPVMTNLVYNSHLPITENNGLCHGFEIGCESPIYQTQHRVLHITKKDLKHEITIHSPCYFMMMKTGAVLLKSMLLQHGHVIDLERYSKANENVNGYTIYKFCNSVDIYAPTNIPLDLYKAVLNFDCIEDVTLDVYFICFNVMRFMSGMGGLGFSIQ